MHSVFKQWMWISLFLLPINGYLLNAPLKEQFTKTEHLLNIYSFSGHPRLVCFFIETEKCTSTCAPINNTNIVTPCRAVECEWMNEWMNEWCIYIALLLCIAIHPKHFTIMGGRGSLLNHHQCAASTWMMRWQPQDNGASALTTHQLQVERRER